MTRMWVSPRLSSMLSLFNTYDESYVRWSVSTSLPTRVAAYYLAFLAFKARLMPLSVSESIRLRRATDSVKRVGCTFSIRYGTANGFKWAIGPWVYYLPGKKVMTRLLPLILSSPALLIAFMNLFVDMREVLGAFLGLESDSFSSYGDSPGHRRRSRSGAGSCYDAALRRHRRRSSATSPSSRSSADVARSALAQPSPHMGGHEDHRPGLQRGLRQDAGAGV